MLTLGHVVRDTPDVKFEQGVKCCDCEETNEVWVCLHCYVVSILVFVLHYYIKGDIDWL